MLRETNGGPVQGAGPRRNGNVLCGDDATVNDSAARSAHLQFRNNGTLRPKRCAILVARLLCGLLLLAVSAGDYSNRYLRVSAVARDDGRYANSLPKPWFDSLASKKGLCCSFADGITLKDVDWDITNDGHYKVRLDDGWHVVPDDALLTVPNKYGNAVIWPYKESAQGEWKIRCFIPGAGT